MLKHTHIIGDFINDTAQPSPPILKYALLVSIIYIMIFSTYIIISSYWAFNFSTSTEQIRQIEILKGCLTGVVSGIILFFATRHVLRRMFLYAEELNSKRAVIMTASRRALAGQITMSVTHDCNNLVMILINNAHLLNRQKELTPNIREQIDRIMKASENLRLLLARVHRSGKEIAHGRPQPLILNEVVSEAMNLTKTHSVTTQWDIRYIANEIVEITGYSILIQQMVMSLILKVSHSMDQGGRITIKLFHLDPYAIIEFYFERPPENHSVPLSNSDSAPFNFSDTDDPKMLTVKATIEAHKGVLEFASPSPSSYLGRRDTCFRIKLPVNTCN